MNMARVTKQLVGVAAAMAALVSLQANADANYSETLVKSKAVRTQTVSINDLNLDTVDGQEALYQRLSNAARRVCGPRDHRIAGGLGVAVDNQACYERALGDALGQVNAGQVATTTD